MQSRERNLALNRVVSPPELRARLFPFRMLVTLAQSRFPVFENHLTFFLTRIETGVTLRPLRGKRLVAYPILFPSAPSLKE